MAKIVKFVCDICGRPVESESDLVKRIIPVRDTTISKGKEHWENLEPHSMEYLDLDLCRDCDRTYWNICDQNFATVKLTHRGIKSFPHFKIYKEN